jgi:DNA-binding LytR/AlgR family response regulator
MLNELRCLIVDDEPLAIDVIENYLKRLDISAIKRCENAIEAFRLLQHESIDVIFLDIEMPLLTGLDFLKSLKNPPAVIITTAYRDYAVEGFELDVVDYLIKPIPFNRFMKAIEKVHHFERQAIGNGEISAGEGDEYLFLKVDRKFVKVLVKDILYIESLKDYIRVRTNSDTWISYQTLSGITEKLPQEKFMRIHRSFTIALDKVSTVEGNSVQIKGQLIPISREQKQEVMRRIHL